MSGKKKKKELKAREEVKSITSRSTKEVKKKEKSTLISIRLSDNMIKDLKHIADVFGIGYQTLLTSSPHFREGRKSIALG